MGMKDLLGDEPFDSTKGIAYQETSREAWNSFLQTAGSAKLDDLIIAFLKWKGSVGATCQEIEVGISRSHQAVSGNLRHLVEKGHVVKTGGYGKTDSGRRAILWAVAP